MSRRRTWLEELTSSLNGWGLTQLLLSPLQVEFEAFKSGLQLEEVGINGQVPEPVETKTSTNVLWTDDLEPMEHQVLEATRSLDTHTYTHQRVARAPASSSRENTFWRTFHGQQSPQQ